VLRQNRNAIYAGLETVCLDDLDYLCKLDMDPDLAARYFALLMQRMASNPRIGTTSGKASYVYPRSGALVPEICGDEMSVSNNILVSKQQVRRIRRMRLHRDESPESGRLRNPYPPCGPIPIS
jgi:hypothetical protein